MKSPNKAPQQTFNTRRHNTLSNSNEQDSSLVATIKKHGKRAIVITALLGVTAGAFGVVRHFDNEFRAGPDTPSGELVESYTKMKIGSGAIVRSSPYVPPAEIRPTTNQLGSYDFGNASEIAIDTPSGVQVFSNEDGKWYGFDVDDLKAAPINGDKKKQPVEYDTDKDGRVWINEQKASVDRSIDSYTIDR